MPVIAFVTNSGLNLQSIYVCMVLVVRGWTTSPINFCNLHYSQLTLIGAEAEVAMEVVPHVWLGIVHSANQPYSTDSITAI